MFVTEDTADWLASSLASIKSNCLDRLIFQFWGYELKDRTSGAAIRALATVEEAVMKLKESTGGSLQRVELRDAEIVAPDRLFKEDEWASLWFPKLFEAGLLLLM